MSDKSINLIRYTGVLKLKKKCMASSVIHGHDPLMSSPPSETYINNDIFNTAIKDAVKSILRCYTGFFDIFSETIQNALDATQKKYISAENYSPKIWIEINIKESVLRVIDNGCGMDLQEFLFCFRPNISFKKGQNLRGNKGVGATFLAYGYNLIKLQTKIGDNTHSAILRQGRQWIEDNTGNIPRPKFEETDFNVPELWSEVSGTSVEITLTGSDNEKPKKFGWYNASKAEQWFDILRLVTPLGGIYLTRAKYKPNISIKVIDITGTETNINNGSAEFYYPHEIKNIKEADLKTVRKEINNIEGDLKTRMNKLPAKYKSLELLWDIWDYKDILSAEGDYLKLDLSESDKTIIEKYEIEIYGCQVDSLETFRSFNEKTGIRPNIKLLKGGIQLATDSMPQGDLIPIALKRNSGLQEYTFIIIHFKFGDPDTGRKNFQPELKEVAEKLASKITAFIINYRDLLRPDTGATKNLIPDKEKHEWIKRLEKYRDQNPLPTKGIGKNFTYLSKAQEEQDVISIFNQLIGMGILRGIYFFGNEYNEKYDSLIELLYEDETFLYSENNLLGVRNDIAINDSYQPMVLEYKYDFDALLRDIDSALKFHQHIDFVVCWKASKTYKENLILKSLLIEKEGNVRTIFGATHQAFLPGRNDGPVFEVLIIEELINFLLNREFEIANQMVKYGYK